MNFLFKTKYEKSKFTSLRCETKKIVVDKKGKGKRGKDNKKHKTKNLNYLLKIIYI